VLGVTVGVLPSAYYLQIRAYPRKSAAKLSSLFLRFTIYEFDAHRSQLAIEILELAAA
jgi:hypothetical protein